MSVGTAATVAIGLGLAGGQTAASVYNSRRAGNTNDRVIAATERSDTRAAEEARLARETEAALRREEAERLRAEAAAEREARAAELRAERETRERARLDALTRDRERWADYTRINEPHWSLGGRTLGNLYEMAGVSGGGPPMRAPGGASLSSFDGMSEGIATASRGVGGVGGAPPTGGIGTEMMRYSAPQRPIARRPATSTTMPVPMPNGGAPQPGTVGGLSLQDLMMMLGGGSSRSVRPSAPTALAAEGMR